MFKVPEVVTDPAGDQFEFSIPGHKGVFKVQKVKFCPLDVLEGVEESGPDALNYFSGATDKQRKAVRSLNRDQFRALMQAWYEDSELSAGESQASDS